MITLILERLPMLEILGKQTKTIVFWSTILILERFLVQQIQIKSTKLNVFWIIMLILEGLKMLEFHRKSTKISVFWRTTLISEGRPMLRIQIKSAKIDVFLNSYVCRWKGSRCGNSMENRLKSMFLKQKLILEGFPMLRIQRKSTKIDVFLIILFAVGRAPSQDPDPHYAQCTRNVRAMYAQSHTRNRPTIFEIFCPFVSGPVGRRVGICS